jgi:hypothetical protein
MYRTFIDGLLERCAASGIQEVCMWRKIITVCLTIVAFMFALGIRPSAARGEVDPNKAAFFGTWKLVMTPTEASAADGAKQFNEAVYFEETEVMAEAFASYGFVCDGYWVYAEGPAFYGMMSSGSKGTLYWEGAACGDSISGQAVWVKADGTVWVFNYTGTRVN